MILFVQGEVLTPIIGMNGASRGTPKE